MKSGEFRLPGKKQLYQQADNWPVIVVDVTESPIERPKKTRESITVARKSMTH
jgi:regulator of protease activity HflC (stomatin/prohibitin superfamily)